jgi:hypothetical protein
MMKYSFLLDNTLIHWCKCKNALLPASNEKNLARDLIASLLHTYISTDKPGDAKNNLFNIIGFVICAILKIHPQVITVADIHLMASSVDSCEEVGFFLQCSKSDYRSADHPRRRRLSV